MNQLDAAVAEYNKTITDLSARLANAVMQLQTVQDENASLKKRIDELPKEEKPNA